MTAFLRPVTRLAAGLSSGALRIALVFAVLIQISDATSRLAAQVMPTSWWFELSRVEILPPGTVTIVYRRSQAGDLPVSSIIELLGPGGEQPCAASGRRVIERDTTYAVAPIHRLLPDCAWGELSDGDYRLAVTVTYAVAGTFPKTATATSVNAIRVRAGAIAGATPLPEAGDGP